MITLYNTLSRKKEEFTSLSKNKVNMYVCGPTVYDVPHIGHARSAFIFDFIRRYLEYSGFEVCFVRNVTDVDDKIINKAKMELEALGGNISSTRLKERAKDVAERYLDIYHKQMDVLGIKPPGIEPKATENIEKMIDFINVLISKGFAYVSGSSVYFNIEKFKDYGKLSNQNIEQMMCGVRIGDDKNKKHDLDFVLWKEAKPFEPFWNSPWGEGRPGWHIECSVMSTDILGHQFDIHGGGLDLIFPHHENEIAQAEAATDKPFAKYWIHNGLLFVNGEKMSKSLGNFITISDFLDKYDDPDLLKLAFLYSHYRSAMNYSYDKLEEARRSKERIMIFMDKVERLYKEKTDKSILKDPEVISCIQEVTDTLSEKFIEAMDDDFNTPVVLSVIFEAVKIGNDYLLDKKRDLAEKIYFVNAIKNFILRTAHILGLSLRKIDIEVNFKLEIDRLVSLREKVRKEKNFTESDRLRKALIEKGVIVEDTPEGPIWRKK